DAGPCSPGTPVALSDLSVADHTFEVVAIDSAGNQGSDSRSWTVQALVDQAPIAGNDSYTTTRGETLDVSAPGVLDNDCDPDVAVLCGGGEYRVAGPAAASDSNLQVGPSSVGTCDSDQGGS